MVPGLCTGGGGGPTHHVWICASPRGVWKSQILELGWEEAVPGPCREGQEKNQQQDPSLPTALGHPDHSLLAVVPDPVWEEDSCLHRHHSECPLKCGVHMGMVLPHGMSRAPPKEHRAGQGLLPVTVWCLSLLLLFVLSWDSAPLVPWLLEGWDMWEEEKPEGLVMPTWSLPPLQSAIPFLIMVVVVGSNLFVTYVVAVAAGISVAAAFLLPW